LTLVTKAKWQKSATKMDGLHLCTPLEVAPLAMTPLAVTPLAVTPLVVTPSAVNPRVILPQDKSHPVSMTCTKKTIWRKLTPIPLEEETRTNNHTGILNSVSRSIVEPVICTMLAVTTPNLSSVADFPELSPCITTPVKRLSFADSTEGEYQSRSGESYSAASECTSCSESLSEPYSGEVAEIDSEGHQLSFRAFEVAKPQTSTRRLFQDVTGE
jgi:hypothetical protein